MADQDRNEGPSLELPSFGFRRKKRKKRAAAETEPAPRPEPTTESEPEPVREPEPKPVREPEPEPTPEPAAEVVTEPEAAPQTEEAPAEATPEPAAATPEPRSIREAPAEPQPEPEAEAQPEPQAEPVPVTRESTPESTPAAAGTSGPPLFSDEKATTATAVDAEEDRAEPEPEEGKKKEKKERKPFRLDIGAVPGAMLTGLVVGLLTVGLTWAALGICELIRGAASCGGNGLWVLLLILVAMIFLGAWLLRVCRVSDPGSTSFLAIGLLTVVALLFLVDVMFNWWMIIVIPCVTLLTYTLSSWVTTSFVDDGRA